MEMWYIMVVLLWRCGMAVYTAHVKGETTPHDVFRILNTLHVSAIMLKVGTLLGHVR